MTPKIAVLVPAHNEEDCIRLTVTSLMHQSLPPSQVIVVSDNSTDATVAILSELKLEYGDRGFLFFESVNNPDKKGGALNQAYKRLTPEIDYVMTVDADTIPDNNFLEAAIEELNENPKLGGVCARFRVRPFTHGNIFQRFLWILQKLEYAWFDSSKVEYVNTVMVLSGAGTLMRREIIDQISDDTNGVIWVRSPADDYVLTQELKARGWKVGSIFNSYATTDAMETFQSFYKQRYTWFLWSWVELKRRGFTQATKTDILNFVLVFVALFGQLWVIGLLTTGFLTEVPVRWHILALGLIVLSHLNKVFRLQYVPDRRWYESLIVVSFVPEELYRLFLNVLVVVCFIESRKRKYPNY